MISSSKSWHTCKNNYETIKPAPPGGVRVTHVIFRPDKQTDNKSIAELLYNDDFVNLYIQIRSWIVYETFTGKQAIFSNSKLLIYQDCRFIILSDFFWRNSESDVGLHPALENDVVKLHCIIVGWNLR